MKNLKLLKQWIFFLMVFCFLPIGFQAHGADALIINNGAQFTNSSSVTLTIDATAISFDAVEMRFSNDNSSWTDWVAYNTTYSWNVTNATYGGDSSEGQKCCISRHRRHQETGHLQFPADGRSDCPRI